MATIVQHKESGKKYVLLGSGFGAFQSKKIKGTSVSGMSLWTLKMNPHTA